MTVAISARTPQQALAAVLDRYAPQKLLLIGASGFPALRSIPAGPFRHRKWSTSKPRRAAGGRGGAAFRPGPGARLPGGFAQARGSNLLGGIHNQCQPHRRAGRPQRLRLARDRLFSLALQASERFTSSEDQVLTLFTYDLLEYKQQVPDWLNSRFWANPENFGKYWW